MESQWGTAAKWANDTALGFLVTAAGFVGVAITLLFGFWGVTPYLLGVVAAGLAIALFGGFEYFRSRAKAQGD